MGRGIGLGRRRHRAGFGYSRAEGREVAGMSKCCRRVFFQIESVLPTLTIPGAPLFIFSSRVGEKLAPGAERAPWARVCTFWGVCRV